MKPELLSVAEFAEAAGVSKAAIYKRMNNESSRMQPYVVKYGGKTYISPLALKDLYGIAEKNSPASPGRESKKEDSEQQAYIMHLEKEIEELKTHGAAREHELTEMIKNQNNIIMQQQEQILELSQKITNIAVNLIAATAQQKYLPEKTHRRGLLGWIKEKVSKETF